MGPKTDMNSKTKRTDLLLKLYLICYNSISFYGWSRVLYHAIQVLRATDGHYQVLYAHIGQELRLVQTLAIFEIINTAMGLVKSPVMITTTQVFSRLLLVWGILYTLGESQVQRHWSFTTMVFAWSLTEVIRYSFYGLSQFNLRPFILTWLRYTSFLPLYPLGVLSECTIIYRSLNQAKSVSPALYYGLWVTLIGYLPGFYGLYAHMLQQRRKTLGPKTMQQRKSKTH